MTNFTLISQVSFTRTPSPQCSMSNDKLMINDKCTMLNEATKGSA